MKRLTFLSSVFAVIVGLIVGFAILIASNPGQSVGGFVMIVTGALTHGTKGLGQILYYATPIMLTGLSVGFAFKTGLFNIGASGQFIVGAFASVYIGITMTSLGHVHWLVAVLCSIIAGGLWALIPGILKAYANVNEVISCIMMNYIGMYAVNSLVKNNPILFDQAKNQSYSVAQSAVLPKLGLNKLFVGSSVNCGIFIAILAVILIHVILNKTVFGFELKAVGLNHDASKYAGVNEKTNIILSMVIAGALSGLGGGLLYLAGSGKHIEVLEVLADEGFTGMSVALLGLSNPFGILIAALFIAYITEGGFYLQLFDFAPEIIDIIISVIIYFSAFALLFQVIIKQFTDKHSLKKNKKEDIAS